MEKFYTLPEIADILRCSIPAIRRRIKEGKLKAVKNGRAYIVSQSALDSYLQTSEISVNDNLVTDTDTPTQPTAGKNIKAVSEAQQPQPDDTPTLAKPSSVPEWSGISGKPIAPLPDSWKK